MRISDWSSDVCSSDLSSVRVEVEFVQRLSARGDGDELDRAEILVKAQRQTPAFGSHQLLYITHGIKFARIKRHAIGWRHDARPVLICIVVKYFRDRKSTRLNSSH